MAIDCRRCRALITLADHAFNSLGYQHLLAAVEIGNLASKKTLEKAGFKLDATDANYNNEWLFSRNKPISSTSYNRVHQSI